MNEQTDEMARRKYALILWYKTKTTAVVPITTLMKNHRVIGVDSEMNKNEIKVLSIGGKYLWHNKIRHMAIQWT